MSVRWLVSPDMDIAYGQYNTSINSGSTLSGSRVDARKYTSISAYGLSTSGSIFQVFINFVGVSNQTQWIQLSSGSLVANVITGSQHYNVPYVYTQIYNTSNTTRESGSLFIVGKY